MPLSGVLTYYWGLRALRGKSGLCGLVSPNSRGKLCITDSGCSHRTGCRPVRRSVSYAGQAFAPRLAEPRTVHEVLWCRGSAQHHISSAALKAAFLCRELCRTLFARTACDSTTLPTKLAIKRVEMLILAPFGSDPGSLK
jgi:hypothetical protein